MKNYFFVCGQIRAQESKLLNVSRLDRMIGAKSPEDAFRVFMELQYANYVDNKTQTKDFAKIIQKGLCETKDLLVSGTENASGLQFLWLPFDINNIKRTLKLKYLEGKDSIEKFSHEEGFSFLGNITQSELTALVFSQEAVETVPEPIVKVISTVDEILEAHDNEFRFVEYALDQAQFEVLKNIAKRAYSPFLKKLLKFSIDMTNFRNVTRSTFILGEKLQKEAWLKGGSFPLEATLEIENIESFISWAKQTRFESILKNLDEKEADEVNLIKVEKELDAQYQRFLEDSVLGEVASIQVPYSYFEKRLRNSRLLKFIMFSKFHNIKAEEIYKTLETF